MDKNALGQAVGFVATISIIFMFCYIFNITQTPFFLLLLSLMSFGYMLCLLALYKDKRHPSFYTYFFIGLLFIILCIALSFTTPHETSFFH